MLTVVIVAFGSNLMLCVASSVLCSHLRYLSAMLGGALRGRALRCAAARLRVPATLDKARVHLPFRHAGLALGGALLLSRGCTSTAQAEDLKGE